MIKVFYIIFDTLTMFGSTQLRSEMQAMGKRLYEADDQILTVLLNIDKRLTGNVENHEQRITKLEQVVA